jgi:hypothetical protein
MQRLNIRRRQTASEEMVVSAHLIWRAVLLGVVFAADVVVFIGLCRDELRDWRMRRQPRDKEPMGEGASALPSSAR